MKRASDLWAVAFVMLWSIALLLLQGCFGEAPTIGGLEAEGEDGEGTSSSGTAGPGGSTLGSGGATSGSGGTSATAWADTDAGEESEESTAIADSSSSESGSSSSSTGYGASPYPPCEECPGQPCIEDGADAGACAPGCGDGCPDPGWGAPACLNEVADGTQGLVCFLDCTDSRTCEAGMVCMQTQFTSGGLPLWACLWEGGAP